MDITYKLQVAILLILLSLCGGCGDIPIDVSPTPFTLEAKDIFNLPGNTSEMCLPAALEQAYLVRTFVITNSKLPSGCELKLVNSGRLKIKQIQLTIDANTLNFSIPRLNIYAAAPGIDASQLTDLDESKVSDLVAAKKLILVGTTPAIKQGGTQTLTLSGNAIPKEVVKDITEQTLPLVVEAAEIVPPLKTENGQDCYARPSGALRVVPTLDLEAFPNITDLGCDQNS